MDESGEGSDVSRVEDNYNVLDVRAVCLDFVAEIGSDLTVALEKILACHTFLAGSAAGRDDVFRILECNFGIYGVGNVRAFECAVADFLINTVNSRLIDVIKADIGGKTKHKGALYHIGTNHSAGTYDEQFFVCKILHNI